MALCALLVFFSTDRQAPATKFESLVRRYHAGNANDAFVAEDFDIIFKSIFVRTILKSSTDDTVDTHYVQHARDSREN